MCLRQKVIIQLEESKSFHDHVTYVHDFWSYCNYLIYLSQKEKQEMNGLESHIRELIDNRSNAWIPSSNPEIEEEASRKKLEQSEKELNEKIDKIITSNEKAQETFKGLDEKIKKIQEDLEKVPKGATPESTATELAEIKKKIESVLEAVAKK